MSDVDALVGWLREVWDADEKTAREATGRDGTDATWRLDDDGETVLFWDPMPDAPGMGETIPDRAAHVARHDPADTLARIQAERAILDSYRIAADDAAPRDDAAREPMNPRVAIRLALEGAVRALAWGYRHRPGWQEGWAP